MGHFDEDKKRKPMDARHRAFLRDYKLKGGGMTLEAFYRMTGYKKLTIMRWRTDIEGFKPQMDEISAVFRGGPYVPKEALGAKVKKQAKVGLLKEKLPKELVAFLDKYGETNDRIDALEHCGLDTTDIDQALAESPTFRQAYGEIRERLRWAIEDQNERQAIGGSPSAVALYLQNKHPDYQKKSKVEVSVSGSVSVRPETKDQRQLYWRDKFGSLTSGSMSVPVLPAAVEGDMVNAEYEELPA